MKREYESGRRYVFRELEEINERPKPFERYTAADLWTEEYTSAKMLEHHLNDESDASSRSSAFIEKSVEWITSRFNVGTGARIADFGCGPGLYTTRLARTGAAVFGIDFSTRSIRFAQDTAVKEGLEVRYVSRNYLEYETDDRFHLILMIMCDFCALSPDQRGRMLEKFRRLLEPGGAILLDVYSLAAYDEREETVRYEKNLLNGFWSPNPYHGFLNAFKYEDEKVILDKYTIIEASRTRTVYNWLQYFSPDALRTEFEENGLEIVDVLGDVAGAVFEPGAPEFAVVATKP
jgi:2-polyprenyl-3-methyl-5-hydroxy-6-metoxy-1,4-benzoquinol methylase